ncbi:MAG TPA: cysteine-rich CWC family protein [Pyrinomonadaceae bacterium]|jgi:hypothetical protein|nr:cysteine-rich CWC family protein [Pyrinomonadaceae bacterium]
MLRDFINRPLLKRSRTCESCGSDFECQIGLKGCWCSEINLSDEARKRLVDSYEDCLCRGCLENVETRTK